MRIRPLLLPIPALTLVVGFFACGGESSSGGGEGPPAHDGGPTLETSTPIDGQDSGGADAGAGADADAEVDASKVLQDGMLEPVPYTSKADSPFEGVAFPSYFHFEDWEDSALSTPGVTASSDTLGSSFGPSLIDSIDGDDGVVDGKCEKDGGTCNSAFANGTIEFTFDAVALGQLPSHVGIAWTDGAPSCDAIFEAYDATDTLIGTRTASGVADGNVNGGTAEDRFFGVVHTAGVKRIVVKSSAGGVEVDHLTYGR